MIDDGTVVIAGGRIRWCGPTAELPAGVDVETTQVPLILPGLVDVHCHGAVGHTFSADAEGARRAAGYHAAQGTTSVLASLVSAPSDVLLEQITVLRELVQDGTLAGLHLEGPFITRSMCGAQDPAAIIDGDPALLKRVARGGAGHGPVHHAGTGNSALCRTRCPVPGLPRGPVARPHRRHGGRGRRKSSRDGPAARGGGEAA